MTLLEEAKNIKTKKRQGFLQVSDETIELAFAVIKGEVSQAQVKKVFSLKSGTACYSILYRSLLIAFKQGRIKIIDKHE